MKRNGSGKYLFQNRRWECFKILAAALFLLCSRPLGGILSDSLTYRYGWRNTEYILRLIALLFLIGSVYFIGRRFFRFRRTDYESLLLLGMPDSCVLSWFLFTNLSFFFIQAAFVLLLTDAGSVFWAEAVLSGMVNGLLLSLAAILFIQSPLFSHRKLLLCIGVLFAGLVLCAAGASWSRSGNRPPGKPEICSEIFFITLGRICSAFPHAPTCQQAIPWKGTVNSCTVCHPAHSIVC